EGAGDPHTFDRQFRAKLIRRDASPDNDCVSIAISEHRQLQKQHLSCSPVMRRHVGWSRPSARARPKPETILFTYPFPESVKTRCGLARGKQINYLLCSIGTAKAQVLVCLRKCKICPKLPGITAL